MRALKWPYWMAMVLVFLTSTNSIAVDRFNLKNTQPRLAEFEFFAINSEQWLPTYKIPSQRSKQVVLQRVEPYFLQFYANGARQPVGVFDFNTLIKNRQGSTLALNTIFRQETKTQLVEVQKTRQETRTREYTVTKMVPESRTRTVKKYNPKTGKYYTVTEEYVVMKEVKEQKTANYMVSVPYTEQQERTYVVNVPSYKLVLQNNGREEFVEQLAAANFDFRSDFDTRQRYLGVSLRKGRVGVAVTKVNRGTAATRMWRVSEPHRRNITFQTGYDEITHVNGEQVVTPADVINAVKNSPPTITMRVYERRYNRYRSYQTKLGLR